MIKVFGGLLFACVLACANPVNVTYVNAGDGTNNGYYYVGPYALSIAGGPDVAAICVDPLHESNPGTTWLANLTPLGSGDLSNTYQPGSGTQYDEAAYLFSLITQPGANRVGIQEAIWQIMDPGDTDPGIHTSGAAAGFITEAQEESQDNFAGFDLSQYMIVSSANTPLQQEFLTFNTVPVDSAPEPSTFALLGLAFAALGVLPFRKRKLQ